MSVNSIALTIDEAAEYTGIGRNTLRQLIEWQKVPTLYVGGRILIRKEILERFIELNDGRDLRNRSSVVKAGQTKFYCFNYFGFFYIRWILC